MFYNSPEPCEKNKVKAENHGNKLLFETCLKFALLHISKAMSYF